MQRRSAMSWWVSGLVVTAGVLSGCGDNDTVSSDTPGDASIDASKDGGTDGSLDATIEGSVEAEAGIACPTATFVTPRQVRSSPTSITCLLLMSGRMVARRRASSATTWNWPPALPMGDGVLVCRCNPNWEHPGQVEPHFLPDGRAPHRDVDLASASGSERMQRWPNQPGDPCLCGCAELRHHQARFIVRRASQFERGARCPGWRSRELARLGLPSRIRSHDIR